MNNVFGRHINTTIDGAVLLVVSSALVGAYLLTGYDGRSLLLGYLLVRVFSIGWNADKYFNEYLDWRYGPAR